MAVNKVIKSDGTTLIDITGTTATVSDVAEGKVFFAADGTEQTGTAVMGGGSAIAVVDTEDSHGGTIRTITAVDLSADTVTAATLLQGYTAHDRLGNAITGTASGGGGASLQAKSVTPSESPQTVTPDSGYDGLSSVSVGAISSTYVGTGVTRQAAKTVTPTKSAQTAVASGVYTTGAITVAAIPAQYITTTDATATAAQINIGATAYVNGAKVTGTQVIQHYYTGSSDPSSSTGSDGDIYLKVVS